MSKISVPWESVVIGSWYMMLDLRRRFCARLTEDWDQAAGQLSWSEELGNLIEEALELWTARYQQPWFLRELELEARKQGLDDTSYKPETHTSLLAYLEQQRSSLSEGANSDPGEILEGLILPYLMVEEVGNARKSVNLWFPNSDFVDLTYKELMKPLYPFLKPSVFELLRSREGLKQAPATSDNAKLKWLEAYGSGMRSLQPKLISSFDGHYSVSRFEDWMAGNGSGFMTVPTDDSGAKLGVLAFCSPLEGLFHRIYVDPHLRKAGITRTQTSNFICSTLLSPTEWNDAASEGGDTPQTADSEAEPVDRLLIRNVEWEDSQTGLRHMQVLLCRSCGPAKTKDDFTSHCPFIKIAEWVNTIAGSFLQGVRATAQRAELEQTVSLLHNFGHDVTGPLAALAAEFDRVVLKEMREGWRDEQWAQLERFAISLTLLWQVSDTSRSYAESLLPMIGQNHGEKTSGGSVVQREDGVFGEGWCDLDRVANLLRDHFFIEKLLDRSDGVVLLPIRIKGIPMPVSGNRGAWSVVLFNLLKNAIKAADRITSENTAKEVCAEIVYQDGFRPGHSTKKATITIRNPSRKIPKAHVQAIQNMLVDNRDDRLPPNPHDAGSSRLGLRICRDLVAQVMGGELHFDQRADGIVEVSVKGVELHETG